MKIDKIAKRMQSMAHSKEVYRTIINQTTQKNDRHFVNQYIVLFYSTRVNRQILVVLSENNT